MGAIDIGFGAVNTSYTLAPGPTCIDINNAANDTGKITSFEFWFALINGGGVKVGTFYGSGTSWTSRDVETIGTVTKDSKQTFSGLDCDVTSGDYAGMYCSSGYIRNTPTGQGGVRWKTGDQFGAGTQTYGLYAGDAISIYGIGATTLTQKSLSGTLNSSGSLSKVKESFKSLAGTLSLSGALSTLITYTKSLAGTLNLSGAVASVYKYSKSIAGTLSLSGLVGRTIKLAEAGTLTSSGSLSGVKGIFKSLAGTLNLSGALASIKKSFVSLAGSLTSSGALGVLVKIDLAGALTSSGALGRKITKSLAGTLTSAGALALKIKIALAGSLTSSGAMSLLWRIIGAKAVSVDSFLTINTFHLSKFVAEFTGIITKIRVYSSASGDVKVAIYSDVGGEPSSLLAVVNTPTAVVAGWNTIAISNTSIGLGTDYWLAFNSG